ncbi:CAP domain-containing protein [Streptomyces sp. CA-294286]|uniref:CAP domain-containing protein n=1 Tax=Streptomyces sp. CA-294286 TaxID=3240070 RepID=UPI003D8C31B5
MGRHRRTAAGPATDDHAPVEVGGHRGDSRRRKRSAPVRSGLLGVSAAVAFGAVAVASGILPGGDALTFGGGSGSSGDRASAGGTVDLRAQGGAVETPTERASSPAAARGEERAQGPAPTPSQSTGEQSSPAAEPTGAPASDSQKHTRDEATKEPTTEAPATTTPPTKAAPKPPRTTAPATERAPAATPPPRKAPASANDAAAAVLSLVNQERAKAGCRPVRPDTGLATLAANFSRDMAARGFFAHTDPDGATPWDRAAKAGIKDLGGENIARGQADAQAVMDAWMNSEGHRANILNCEYTTLGVGVHMAEGGPWWTQNFGF